MGRFNSVFGFLLIILLFVACSNPQSSVLNELKTEELETEESETQETEMLLVQDIDTSDIFNLLVSNLNLRMKLIADSMKEIARNQEALEVLIKDEEDYNSLFDMIQDREEVIGLLIDESMLKNPSIHRIYFLSEDGGLIIDSDENDSAIYEIRPNNSDDFNVIPYLNINADMVLFQALLRYMPTGESVYVVYEVDKEDLLIDVYQTQQSLSDNYYIEVLDVDGTNLFESNDTSTSEQIHSMMNTYNWEISILLIADE